MQKFLTNRCRDCEHGWDVADDTLRRWIILAKQLMGDVEGKYVGTNQVFQDGWEYQQIIESIRSKEVWTPESC